MSKNFVDHLIHNLKLADMVTKASPWMVEGRGDAAMNVRFVGIKLKDDWLDIFPPGNNLLIKFVVDRNTALMEFYLANKPPFFRIFTKRFTDNDKWETLLGDFKRRLKKEKAEFINHTEEAGNIYSLLQPHLK